MKIISFFLAVPFFLSGCVTYFPVEQVGDFTAKEIDQRVMNRSLITWQIEADVDSICKKYLNISTLTLTATGKIHGCSIRNKVKNTCVIVTNKNTSHVILGHELRHCFEGDFH